MTRVWMLWLGLFLAAAVPTHAQSLSEWRAPSQAEQAQDAIAFEGTDAAIAQQYGDVQSAVVVLRGRVVYEFYRDGAPGTLRDTQSVAKSALSALAGIALGQGRIASLDQPVLALMPEWTQLNGDPRSAAITVRHLLTMTAGFEVNDASGTAPAGRPADAWARPLRSAPGQAFAYDNAIIPMLTAVIEKAAGIPLADYARQDS
jgi:CubicO group peptidase (beta-lactamase class C family)